jgi:hypothetical protein
LFGPGDRLFGVNPGTDEPGQYRQRPWAHNPSVTTFHGNSGRNNGLRVTDVTDEEHGGDPSENGCGAERGGCLLRIRRRGHRPADHEKIGSRRDGFGRRPDASLIVGRPARETDPGYDRQQM